MKRLGILIAVILIFCNKSHSATIKIIDAGSFYFTSDSSWYQVATDMGHTATINPLSTLNDTTFYATTDILIVSGGTISYSTLQINNILGFIKRGKSVYLQAEYLISFSSNAAFEYLVEELGGTFDWISNLTGDLDVDVVGGLGSTYETVTSLPYFWYGASGSGDCSVFPFLKEDDNEVGWIFTPATTTYGRLICTTDQDWIGSGFSYTETQLLMENIVNHLDDYDLGVYTKNSLDTIVDSVCSSAFPYTWNGLSITGAGTYSYETTTADGLCDSIVRLQVILLSNTTTISDTICYGSSYEFGDSVFTTTGIHNVVFDGSYGCDSIIAINLFVRPLNSFSYYDTICAGGSYSFGGMLLTTSGTYRDTLSAGGCDSIVILHLWRKSYPVFSFSDNICAGESYMFNGISLTEGGVYRDTITTAGCDSIVKLTLVVDEYLSYSFSQSICAGEAYNFGGTLITANGIYVDTFSTSGCDSIVTLTLVVDDYLTFSFTENLCAGETYTFNGITLTSSGTYRDTFSTSSCDSIVTLLLNIGSEITTSATDFACFGETYIWGDLTLSEPGTYSQVFTAANGCDSMVTLVFTIDPEIINAVSTAICFGTNYVWGDMVLTDPGTYVQTFTAASGCDSTVILELSIEPEIITAFDTLVCFGTNYEWGGMILSETGVYTQVFASASGCDSSVTLSLVVKPEAITSTSSLEGCNVVSFEGNNYYESIMLADTFEDIDGCDSIYRFVAINVYQEGKDTLNISICTGDTYKFNNTDYSIAGQYIDTLQTMHGCDSIVTLLLTVNQLPVITIEQLPNEGGVCVNDSIAFTASGGTVYLWYNNMNEITAYGEKVKIMLPEYNNRIMVKGTDENGCIDTTSISIVAYACCDLVMPSAFSPNNDGLNDRFGPVTFGNPIDYQFQIYNKWGQRIFVSFKGEDHWDGTIKGEPAPLGTYFYQLTGKCVSGEKLDRKGDVTLVR